jgi:hypothetical protein
LSRCCLARMMDRTCCATTESTYTCTQSCNLARARFGHSCTRQLIARVLINILRRIDILMQLSQTSHSVTVGVVALQKPLIQSCNEQVDTIRTCRPKNSVRCANKDSLYYVYIYIYTHGDLIATMQTRSQTYPIITDFTYLLQRNKQDQARMWASKARSDVTWGLRS